VVFLTHRVESSQCTVGGNSHSNEGDNKQEKNSETVIASAQEKSKLRHRCTDKWNHTFNII